MSDLNYKKKLNLSNSASKFWINNTVFQQWFQETKHIYRFNNFRTLVMWLLIRIYTHFRIHYFKKFWNNDLARKRKNRFLKWNNMRKEWCNMRSCNNKDYEIVSKINYYLRTKQKTEEKEVRNSKSIYYPIVVWTKSKEIWKVDWRCEIYKRIVIIHSWILASHERKRTYFLRTCSIPLMVY